MFGFQDTNIISSDTSKGFNTDILVIPGVGSFGYGSSQIYSNRSVLTSINDHLAASKLVIGICLGAQLLLESSEESPGFRGLAYIKALLEFYRLLLLIRESSSNWLE